MLTTEEIIEVIENYLEDTEFPGRLSVTKDTILVECFNGSAYQIYAHVEPLHVKYPDPPTPTSAE